MINKAVFSYTTIIVLFALFCGTENSFGATIDELKQKIDERSTTIKQLEQEIGKYQQELTKTVTQKADLQTTIKSLDLNAKKLSTDLKVTESKIEKTNYTIAELNLEINAKEKAIYNSRQALADALRNIEIADSKSLIEVVLSNSSITTFWGDVETMSQYQDQVSERISELKNLKSNLEDNKSQAEGQKKNLVVLKVDLSDKKSAVEANKSEKNRILAETKNKESEYKKLINEKLAKKAAFEQEMLQYESEIKKIIDPKSIPKSHSGVLAWPVTGPMTQEFGMTDFAAAHSRLYNGNGHNGIDIGIPIGTPIKSALDGTVLGSGNTDTVCPGASYGKWVLIKHNNGLTTLYAHLSVIKVTAGQNVSTGEVIGLSGVTGFATGPHLHFTVYASQGVEIMSRPSKSCGRTYTLPVADLRAYLNPMLYL